MKQDLEKYEFSSDRFPTLYRLGDKYLLGLAEIMGVQYCYHERGHSFVQDKCEHCGIRRKFKEKNT